MTERLLLWHEDAACFISFSSKRLITLVTIFFFAQSICALAATIRVDGLEGLESGDGSQAHPFKTIDEAWRRAKAGDVVLVEPTITYGPVAILTSRGLAGREVQLRGDVGRDGIRPRITGSGRTYGIQINDGASFVVVSGFDVTAPGHWSGILVGRGSHDVEISGNIVHDCGNGGISTVWSDRITIINNDVFGNSKDTSNHLFTSGISIYEPTTLGVREKSFNIIRGNRAYENTNYHGPLDVPHSDGNGIIVDDGKHTQGREQPEPYNKPYLGMVYVDNNLVHDNGGRGIHIFHSDNVVVENNTAWNDGRDPLTGLPNAGEITVIDGSNVQLGNNKLRPTGGFRGIVRRVAW